MGPQRHPRAPPGLLGPKREGAEGAVELGSTEPF